MKSSEMMKQLEDARQSGNAIALPFLHFFIQHGSFNVRALIFQHLQQHSSATSSLHKEPMFYFMLSHLQESYTQIERWQFSEDCRVFLFELSQSKLDVAEQRAIVEQFLALMQNILKEKTTDSLWMETSVIDRLVEIFPEFVNNPDLYTSPQIRTLINNSKQIHGMTTLPHIYRKPNNEPRP